MAGHSKGGQGLKRAVATQEMKKKKKEKIHCPVHSIPRL
jgi:hypothetical protein